MLVDIIISNKFGCQYSWFILLHWVVDSAEQMDKLRSVIIAPRINL